MKTQKKEIVIYIPQDRGFAAFDVLEKIQARVKFMGVAFKENIIHAVTVTYDAADTESHNAIESLEWPKESVDSYLERFDLLYHKGICIDCGKKFRSKKKSLYCSQACRYEHQMKQIRKLINKLDSHKQQ